VKEREREREREREDKENVIPHQLAFFLVPIIGSLLDLLNVEIYFAGSIEKPEILLSTNRWQDSSFTPAQTRTYFQIERRNT
jgi:hypothetical protein